MPTATSTAARDDRRYPRGLLVAGLTILGLGGCLCWMIFSYGFTNWPILSECTLFNTFSLSLGKCSRDTSPCTVHPEHWPNQIPVTTKDRKFMCSVVFACLMFGLICELIASIREIMNKKTAFQQTRNSDRTDIGIQPSSSCS